MKSVKENFDRRTSQRFEEYEERMKDKRQKRKEQRDKNIQKIIEKDKMEKSLAEKVEKGCLRCGCALGGVAACIGLIGGLTVNELKKAALLAATQDATAEGLAAGAAARIKAGIDSVISGITEEFGVSIQGVQELQSLYTAENDTVVTKIADVIYSQYDTKCLSPLSGTGHVAGIRETICISVAQKSAAARNIPVTFVSHRTVIRTGVEKIVSDAEPVAETAAQQATNEVIQRSIDAVEFAYSGCQTAITASVVAILVIVLVMIIIYLVLRHRRKKKMNKKAQYTKLLNQ
ncbi:rifin PIR protein, putative [Plasmodium reichenowi]|uniref:Rifin PIR protein, putative n=1 Tax=Plasmodium reichenowi TaxID=5854 RepID=A0A2P9DTL1_PLARE|nr:rifin PIR protein, putative [Plasmodium reichenowi]